ncbi:probable inactive serine/threonine-protein kinase slob2 [Jatropha curcas]|uniref:probable inactive serine/threonine-protein kinase slob2 n=1 Tax=Jatropha curcas TaxID=180498 RepID=UPI0009D7857E|nr:probable inactive serine/threonine-protein kinase slob2 [Jatropha curcas]
MAIINQKPFFFLLLFLLLHRYTSFANASYPKYESLWSLIFLDNSNDNNNHKTTFTAAGLSPGPAPEPTIKPTPGGQNPPKSPPPSPKLSPPPPSPPPPGALVPPPSPSNAEPAQGKDGLSGGQKAGIVIGTLAGSGLLVFGGMIYKKRRSNIRRARFGSAARASFL